MTRRPLCWLVSIPAFYFFGLRFSCLSKTKTLSDSLSIVLNNTKDDVSCYSLIGMLFFLDGLRFPGRFVYPKQFERVNTPELNSDGVSVLSLSEFLLLITFSGSVLVSFTEKTGLPLISGKTYFQLFMFSSRTTFRLEVRLKSLLNMLLYFKSRR